MKKLMIAAALAAATVSANAGIAMTNCHKKVSLECPQIVFKVTASGKTVGVTEKGDASYKSVQALKVSKGALVFFGEAVSGTSDCCYNLYSLYLNAKVGKKAMKIAILAQDLEKWSVFGKGIDDALVATKAKSFKLDSDLGLWFDDDTSTDSAEWDEVTGLQFFATAFGKATYKYAPAGEKSVGTGACKVCKPTAESESVVPGNYKGWFAGWFDLIEDGYCMNCACSNNDIFGGTWTAKYNKAWSSKKNGWQSAAAYAFGAGALAEMIAEEVE